MSPNLWLAARGRPLSARSLRRLVGVVLGALLAGAAAIATPAAATGDGTTTSIVTTNASMSTGLSAIDPSREVDTRRGLGGGLLRAGERRFLPLGSVPGDATSIVANVTATDASAPGYLVVDDCSSGSATSALNLVPGRAVPNQVVVGLAADGRRGVCVRASTDTHVIVDLFGVIRPGGAMVRPTPLRLHDSRSQGGIGTDGVLRVDLGPALTGRSGATAWTGTVTATDVTVAGYVTVWPCASRRPEVSQLNLAPGVTAANQVTVALPAHDRTLCLRRVGRGQLIVDSTGVWTEPSSRTVRPVSPPRRAVDTRAGAPVQPGEIRRVHAQSDAVLMVNVTATRSAGPGWVAAFECGAGHQGTSTVNLVPGTDVAASATVAAGSGGVCITASARTDVVVDVFAVQQRVGVSALPGAGVPLVGEVLRPGVTSDPDAPLVSACRLGPLDEVNAARRRAGLPPFVSDARTDSFACQWATHMASVARMAHSTQTQRAGIDACGVNAENIAMGSRGWEWMMGAWLESPPHRENMFHPALERASVAYVSRTEQGRVMWYGAMAFGGFC